jgi:predicted nucleotidyltransferase
MHFDFIHIRRDEIIRIAARCGAHNLRIFGSIARGEREIACDLNGELPS